MSLSQVRTYFQTIIAAVDSDYREWVDAFNVENIPSSVFNKSRHYEIDQVSSGPLNDRAIVDDMSVNIRLFYSGFRDVATALATAIDGAHNFRTSAVSPSNAMSGTNIKNVVCNSIRPEPLESNDNKIKVTMNFTVELAFASDDG